MMLVAHAKGAALKSFWTYYGTLLREKRQVTMSLPVLRLLILAVAVSPTSLADFVIDLTSSKESSLDKPAEYWLRGDRLLKSSESESRDEDDFFKDEEVETGYDYRSYNRDDDFYKFVGDPLPPRLFPLTRRDVVGFMLASLGVTLGSSGGIGGGGLVVPCYILAMGMYVA